MGRKNKETGQASMFDLTGKPTEDYGTTAADIDKILKSIPLKEKDTAAKDISGKVASELTETLKAIETFTEAGVNEKESVFGFVPFFFYETGNVNPRQTAETFSREDCINFYLDIIDRKPGYRTYKELIPNIRKYFKVSLDRNEKDEGLRGYGEMVRSLPNECREKIMVSINGGIDFGAMKNRFGLETTKKIIDNILNKKAPFEGLFVENLVDKFFENIGATENIRSFENNIENLMEFFDIILFSFKNNGIDDQIEHLGNDMWDSYEKLFKMLSKAYDITHKDGDIEDNDFSEIRDRFEENYENIYRDSLKDTIIEIVRSMAGSFVKLPPNTFLPAVFASYRKKGRNSDVLTVYKRNLINKYLRDGSYINHIHSVQEKQDRTNQFKLAVKDIDGISYSGGIITYNLTGMRVGKEKFINSSPEQRKKKVQERIEDREIMAIKINEFGNFLVDEGLDDKFKIRLSTEEIYYEKTYETISLSIIIEEDPENWKIKLFEREEEINRKNNMEIADNEDESLGYHESDKNTSISNNSTDIPPNPQDDEDDDLPF